MACYRPNLMRRYVVKATGEVEYKFIGPAKGYDALDVYDSDGAYIPVPCGRCVGCQIDYARTWANRMILELADNKDRAIFLTLTYDDDHLISNGYKDIDGHVQLYETLDVDDLQKFWKRLRKRFPSRRIRYVIAGEYGPKTQRPHYHAIVYGLDLSDFSDLDLYKCYGKHLEYRLYKSKCLADVWQNGYILVAGCNWHTCNYVSRYVLKKCYGQVAKSEYQYRVPPFILSSRRPGIGMLHSNDMILSKQTSFTVDGNDGVYTIGLPQAFWRKAVRDGVDPEIVYDLLSQRKDNAAASALSDVLMSDKDYWQVLSDRERDKLKQIGLLPDRDEI